MAEFIVGDIKWKKGELGLQRFNLFESDGETPRNGTGVTYTFAFWKKGATAVKGSGSLIAVTPANGEWDYQILATDTDTIDDYIGELIEDPTGAKIRSESFAVSVEESSDL